MSAAFQASPDARFRHCDIAYLRAVVQSNDVKGKPACTAFFEPTEIIYILVK